MVVAEITPLSLLGTPHFRRRIPQSGNASLSETTGTYSNLFEPTLLPSGETQAGWGRRKKSENKVCTPTSNCYSQGSPFEPEFFLGLKLKHSGWLEKGNGGARTVSPLAEDLSLGAKECGAEVSFFKNKEVFDGQGSHC